MDGKKRVLSGMRATGSLHLGHYYGVLKNWLTLQQQYQSFFFVADWHALTTHYATPQKTAEHSLEMVIDWLAIGIDPQQAVLFRQSDLIQHAELHLLLSMLVPLSWLERVPTYKDQQEKLKDKDLSTYGFLGYPLLQSADILIYGAELVPVGEDQVVHVELTREIARRFNHLYGSLAVEDIQPILDKLDKDRQKEYLRYYRQYQESGHENALEKGRKLLSFQTEILDITEQTLLLNYLEGKSKTLLIEPEALLTPVSKMPGVDGQKMSKSYNNTISLRESFDSIEKKLKTMPTDPARIKRNDIGDPEKCPVWDWHKIYSDQAIQTWVQQGCTTADIGCLDCKKPLIDAVIAELEPIQLKAKQYQDYAQIEAILSEGKTKALEVAEATMKIVRETMGLTLIQ